MNLSEFDEITKTVISPLLVVKEGFIFSEGTFVRDFPNQVRHVIMFDFDVRKAKTFRVILGFNSPIISENLSPNEAGVFGVRYLTESGLSDAPSNYPCFNSESALRSLERVRGNLSERGLPWIKTIDSLEKMADIAEERYPFIKGKLYLSAGLLEKANKQLSTHLSYLLKQSKTDAVAKVFRILKICFDVAHKGSGR